MHFVCVSVGVGVTVNDMKILTVAQQSLNGKIISLAITQRVFERNHIPTNWHSFHALHTKAALQQKYVSLHMAF